MCDCDEWKKIDLVYTSLGTNCENLIITMEKGSEMQAGWDDQLLFRISTACFQFSTEM